MEHPVCIKIGLCIGTEKRRIYLCSILLLCILDFTLSWCWIKLPEARKRFISMCSTKFYKPRLLLFELLVLNSYNHLHNSQNMKYSILNYYQIQFFLQVQCPSFEKKNKDSLISISCNRWNEIRKMTNISIFQFVKHISSLWLLTRKN